MNKLETHGRVSLRKEAFTRQPTRPRRRVGSFCLGTERRLSFIHQVGLVVVDRDERSRIYFYGFLTSWPTLFPRFADDLNSSGAKKVKDEKDRKRNRFLCGEQFR